MVGTPRLLQQQIAVIEVNPVIRLVRVIAEVHKKLLSWNQSAVERALFWLLSVFHRVSAQLTITLFRMACEQTEEGFTTVFAEGLNEWRPADRDGTNCIFMMGHKRSSRNV